MSKSKHKACEEMVVDHQYSINRVLRAIVSPSKSSLMKFFSFKCRDLASYPKNLALRRLFHIEQPDVIFFQGNLSEGPVIKIFLESILPSCAL